jgi:hypothetical protein
VGSASNSLNSGARVLWLVSVREMNKRACPHRSNEGGLVIRLNVGGRRFDATRLTLERAAFFRPCFNGDFALPLDDDGCVFLDRDGHLFKHLLAFMRAGRRPPEMVVNKYRAALMEECLYFGLADLALNLQGQTSDFDLCPEDRLLRAAEARWRDAAGTGKRDEGGQLVEVFSAGLARREPVEMHVPLLFTAGKPPRLTGSAADFHARLDAFIGQGLLRELQELRQPDFVIAGGSVIGALTATPAGDVDIFFTCSTEEAIGLLRVIFAAVQRAHAAATGNRWAALLVTRSRAAVTIYRHTGNGAQLPPIQVVLGVFASIADLLLGFDVDCCAVALQPSSGRVVATRRGARAITYGTNLLDTHLDSPCYARRLEKYGMRGWRLGLPGLDETRLAPSLRQGGHLIVQDLLLSVFDERPCTHEVQMWDGEEARKVRPTRIQQAKIVQGPARLFLMGSSPRHSPREPPRLICLGGERVMLLHGVPPLAQPAADDEAEGDSKSPLAAVVQLLQQNIRTEAGGAVGTRPAKGECKEVRGPLSFVYDFASAAVALEQCECVWNAASCAGLQHEDDEAFLQRYGLPRDLRFEATFVRKTVVVDWWDALYNA